MPAVVDERPDPAHDRAGDERVTFVQRAVLHQDGRDGPPAPVQLRLEDRARRVPLRVGLQFADVGNEQDHLEQQVEVDPALGRDLHDHGLAPPLLGHQVQVGQLALHPFRVGIGLVDLVHRHDDRDVGRPRVVDRFARLRHDPVVGRDHQDDHVGDFRAAGAHERERLMARGVQEHDASRVDPHVVGADVLRDSARLAFGDPRLADRIEQGGLPVVDVPHDRDHRGAHDEIACLHVFGLDLQQLLLEAPDLHPAPNSRAIMVAVSVSSVVLMVIISRLSSSLLSTSLTRTSSLSARSLTVMPSTSVTVRVMGGGAAGT